MMHRNIGWIGVGLVLGCSVASSEEGDLALGAGGESVEIERLTCKTSGAYDQERVRASVEGEREALHACFLRLVNTVDATSTRVTAGEFHFGWDLHGAQTKNRRFGGAGGPQSQRCLEAVLARVEGTKSFQVEGRGRLDCSITFRAHGRR